MKRTHTKAGLGLVVLVAACGDLSNEDLVYLAGVPSPDEVALEVDDAQQQTGALTAGDTVGEPAELFKRAAEIARGANGGVTKMLAMVDRLGRRHRPTHRTKDARIWGPVSNVDGKGITVRLEIDRRRTDSGTPRFVFCVHVAQDGDVRGREPTCDDVERGGLRALLSGYYDPRSADGGVRSGSGFIRLDFDVLSAIGEARSQESGALTLSYDFSQGGRAKSIALDWTGPLSLETTLQRFSYLYARDAGGRVDFFFQFPVDAVQGGTVPRLELATIDAHWQEDGAGRGEAQYRGGNIPTGKVLAVTECWDAAHARTYLLWAPPDPSQSFSEGDPALCPP